VLAVLRAQLPVDHIKLEEELPGLFILWDKNGLTPPGECAQEAEECV
jgi:hypothetical protein